MRACILCIEDEATLLRDLCEELESANYQVLAARSVDEALAHLEFTRPDLILSDVMLGGDAQRDGYFIHQYLRTQRPDLAETPFLFLTALGQRDALLEAKRQGVDDYLVKPVDYDMLLATIESRLAQVARFRSHAQRGQQDILSRLSGVFDQLPGAVLLCDQRGHLFYATPKAKHISAEENLWQVNAGGALCWPAFKASSAEKIAKALADLKTAGERKSLAMERHSGDAAVAASVVCLDDGYAKGDSTCLLAVFLSSTYSRTLPDVGTLREVFGLTPTEANVALLMAQGMRTEDVSHELGVSSTTVAFHLRNIFSKTCVTRQSELVALILSTGWAIPSLPAAVSELRTRSR
ncbi:DNA-binding response regulator [Ectopseudomonas mendocina]|uniref:DNA-binding response regulator n=1 Tax=Ectopseudomonas mendocina TaxID=300 RepID=A0ABZ2RF29_ECTME